MNGYCKHKLLEKIRIHLELAGIPIEDHHFEIGYIMDKITQLGRYEIIWRKDKVVDLIRINDEYDIEVNSGKYFILRQGQFIKQLYSSEYIDFNVMEHRDKLIYDLLENDGSGKKEATA